MENRRVLPPLYFEKAEKPHPTTSRAGIPDKTWDKMSDEEKLGHEKDPDKLESKETQFVKRRAKKSEGIEMTRPYTMDEITTAQLLKGHPQAQEIVDTFFKSKKKTEGGEEFQDGSEDSIGPEGHASPARPGTIKHEGGNPVPGPNHPGTSAKNASVEDDDLQKSIDIVGNFLIEKGYDLEETNEIIEEYFGLEKAQERGTLTDNEPNKFKEGIEEDDTIPEGDEGETAEEIQTGKSFTQDEATLDHLRKTMGAERFEELMRAVLPKYSTPGALSSRANAPTEKEKSENPLINRKANPEKIAALTQRIKGGAEKSEGEDNDLEKSKDDQKEEEERENMKDKSEQPYSLEFSEDILKAMGLEKGSPSVSKKVSGGKATQIRYGSEHGEEEGKTGKPETRYTHPKGKEEKRYRFEPKKGEVTVRSREKGNKEAEWKEKKIGVGEEAKLKNASTSSPDLHKALDDILAKRG